MKILKILIERFRLYNELKKNSNHKTAFKVAFVSLFVNKEKRVSYCNSIKLSYLRKEFIPFLQEHKSSLYNPYKEDGSIWVCWWQGENKMPPIVKACYRSLKKNAPENRKVILITKSNFRDYIDLPEYILDKFEKRYITITHLTDLLRLSLLEKYGGLWIDSTVLTTQRIPVEIFEKPFCSISGPRNDYFVSQCMWTGFFMASSKNSQLIHFLKTCLFEYWKQHGRVSLVDYYLLDYALVIACESDTYKKYIIEGALYTDVLYFLQNNMNNKYNSQVFSEVSHKFCFHKLSWHENFIIETKIGEPTYYKHIIDHE